MSEFDSDDGMEIVTESPRTSAALPPPGDGREMGRRQWVGLFAGPVILIGMLVLPAPEGLSISAWRAASVGLMMAVWWMTEALPIAATSLVPLVLFPVLGVADMGASAAPYANPLIFLFMGGFLIALAMERWSLHRRLALGIIDRIGTRPLSIVAGFMLAAAFLSMWISNTATAMMMLPIGLSVVELVRRRAPGEGKNFAVVLMLALAYSCSVGGIGTLVGTPTNALFAGFMSETYGYEISFANWLVLGSLFVIIALPIVFIVLTKIAFPIKIKEIPGGKEFIRTELRAMGAMRRPEKMVAVVFGFTAVMWITRPLIEGLIPGLSDPGIAMFSGLLLFVLPVDARRGIFLLNWTWAERLPWGVLILFGGGLSLASAINDTGLAMWIGSKMHLLTNWPTLGLIAAVVFMIIVLTELTSNTATAAAFLPIVASVAIGIGENPLLFAVPATVAASCAFMLPVATPPNAIIYGSSFITVPQMAKAGVVLNVIFLLFVTALSYALLPFVFDVSLGVVPEWATGAALTPP